MKPDKDTPDADSSALSEVRPDIFYKVDIVVTGAGQAGLSAAYHLRSICFHDWRQPCGPGCGYGVD